MQYIPRCSGNSTYYTIPQSECTKYRKGIYILALVWVYILRLIFIIMKFNIINVHVKDKNRIIFNKKLEIFKNNLNSTQLRQKGKN